MSIYDKLDFEKGNGLIPAVVIDHETGRPLMLGYISRESLEKTFESGRVTFFSRSRKELWLKGETSGNYLSFVSVHPDCDGDAVVIYAKPAGPVCHTGSYSCFEGVEKIGSKESFLYILERIINNRKEELPENSYTAKLFQKGIPRIAQKTGEEAVETVIAAMKQDRGELISEAADLLYHLTVLLTASGISLAEVENKLRDRHVEK